MGKGNRFRQRQKRKKPAGINISASIPPPVIPAGERPLYFSFKHLDITCQKFHSENCSPEFYLAFLKKLREYSGWTVESFTDSNNNDHRHIIDFSGTTEPSGFAFLKNEQLEDSESWQFCLDKSSSQRVHGFILGDTFYVVWLDPNHNLYAEETS